MPYDTPLHLETQLIKLSRYLLLYVLLYNTYFKLTEMLHTDISLNNCFLIHQTNVFNYNYRSRPSFPTSTKLLYNDPLL